MRDKQPDTAAFHRSAELQHQMEQIGARFLDRVLPDLDAMEELLAELGAGNASAAAALEMVAHRIHGSSAIFGFSMLSEAAGAIEALLASVQLHGDSVAAMPAIAEGMAAVRAAAQALGASHTAR